MFRLTLSTVLASGFCFFNVSSAQAQAVDGAIAFHLKVPEHGCRWIGMSVKEQTGKKVYPPAIEYKKSELKPGEFSELIKFNVPEGDYRFVRINCDPKKKFKDRVSYEFEKIETSYGTSAKAYGLNFRVPSGKDVYLGALDPVKVDFNAYATLTTDRSAEAIAKGDLSTGTLVKSFITTDLKHESLLSNYQSSLSKLSSVETNDEKLQASIDAQKPSTDGKGEIAMHLKSDFDCSYVEVGFLPDGTKGRNAAAKTKYLKYKTQKDGTLEDFSTVKVKSGRYRLSGFKCGQTGGRFLQSKSLIRSEIDVYDKEIAYVGDLHFKKTKDNSDLIEAKRKSLELKYPDWDASQIDNFMKISRIAPYEFGMEMSDRIEDAKTRVKKPEKLVKRSFDAKNYKKREKSAISVYQKKIIENRAEALANYAKALSKYDSAQLVKP